MSDARTRADPPGSSFRYGSANREAGLPGRCRRSYSLSDVGFLFLVAFGGAFLATPLVAGGVTTIGIVVGVGVILIAIALTAIYVWKANTTFDDLTRELLEETR